MTSSYPRTHSATESLPKTSTPVPTGFVLGGVRATLRLEGLAVFTAATAAYATTHTSWWLYLALFFLPDISFLAYLLNPRVGAIAYNALHTYIAPVLLAAIAYFAQAPALGPIALIWAAHIGFDRAAGYGLKYASAFGDTHLGKMGK